MIEGTACFLRRDEVARLPMKDPRTDELSGQNNDLATSDSASQQGSSMSAGAEQHSADELGLREQNGPPREFPQTGRDRPRA